MILRELALDRATLAIGGCILLLAAGLLRAWSLSHHLHASHEDLVRSVDDQRASLDELRLRLDHIQRFSDAQKEDTRSRHDGEVVEMLGSLLQLNESLRRSHAGEAVAPPRSKGSGDAP